MLNDRPVVPKALRPRVLDHLNAGHPGLSTLCLRMSSSLYWPDYKDDLTRSKLACPTCRATAPSNPALPPSPPVAPLYPFQSMVCDFFTLEGRTFAAIADRYSNWLSILQLKRDTSQELISSLRSYFSTFGIPELFSSDGASIFISADFVSFCRRWGIQQRISSAYFPRSNKRAEVAVKRAKRMIRDSLGPGGSLDTDSLARALLAHRNTPDPITGLSPAQVIFGRNLRDFMPCGPGKYQPREEWRLTAQQRELAHAKRHIRTEEALSKGSKKLPPLIEGDAVSLQDQSGNTPKRWSKTGRVLEALDFDAYLVKVDGSSRVTTRNRQFLRKIEPYIADTDLPQPPAIVIPTDDHTTNTAVPPTEFIDPDLAAADAAQDVYEPAEAPTPQTRSRVPVPPPQPANAAPPVPVHTVQPTPVMTDAARPAHVQHVMPGPHHLPGYHTLPSQPNYHTLPGHVQVPPHIQPPALAAPRFTPPPPGVSHYDVLRSLEAESRRQAEASTQLAAYLASIVTNTALSSWGEGGIYSSQQQPNPMFNPVFCVPY